VGQWNTKYVHDVQVVSYTSGPYAGKEVAFCCSGFNGGSVNTGLSIVDVTNKANPVVMSEAFYPNPAYSHQGWLSEDRTLFYLGDELDENGTLTTRTHVIDVTNLNSPVVEPFFTNGNSAIGHNMYAKDGLLYQANYTSGLRIFDYASNPLSPTEVAFFDTYPAGDADTFNGMWNVFPYFPSGIVIASDLESGFFVLYPGDPQLDVQVVGGPYDLWNPNGQNIQISIIEAVPGSLQSGTESLVYDAGAGAVTLPLSALGGNLYEANVPPIPCGTAVSWYVQAQSTLGLDWTAPSNAPAQTFASVAAFGLSNLGDFDMEADLGWVSGAAGDDATTGLWTRGNPNGSGAQPEDDHSAVGTSCWFTGQAAVGAAIGTNDVDGGTTTLLSPVFDLSGNPDATIEYWRWYVNNGNGAADDSFYVDITSNGSTWVNVETLAPGNPEAAGGWYRHALRVGDFVTTTSQVRLRFRAVDIGNGSIVEAAIDDLRVSEADCSGGSMGVFCDPANTNSTGGIATISGTGSTTASDNNLVLQASLMPTGQFAYFVTGTGQVAPFVPGGSMGNLCLGGSLGRFNLLSQIGNTGGSGSISLTLDLTSMPTNPTQPVLAGQTWYFQAWYRDVFLGMSTSNFTNGLMVTFQ
ncbi:MAG TPA: choice-of-anchor B family protein, partial [Planctomycetota bacterium]|nr:choice-of-anchor B family protein [Planctomycetota bacterium]